MYVIPKLTNISCMKNSFENFTLNFYILVTKQAPHLQETTGVVLLDDLHAVLHQPSGLTQLHCAVGDLIPDHLGIKTEGVSRVEDGFSVL